MIDQLRSVVESPRPTLGSRRWVMKIRLWFDQARLAMANELDVYLYGERVATVARQGRCTARYTAHVFKAWAVPISVQLPVVPRGHSGEAW